MEEILFSKAVFKEGLNFTVRLGEKWKEKLKIGDSVKLGPIWLGEIKKLYVCRMEFIPEEVFKSEHDACCRIPEDLYKVMKERYPELRWDSPRMFNSEVVTCIGFMVYKIL